MEDNFLNIRVSSEVLEAYDAIARTYDVNRAELARIAPLLFVLLAETVERKLTIAPLSVQFYDKEERKGYGVSSEFPKFLKNMARKIQEHTDENKTHKEDAFLPNKNVPVREDHIRVRDTHKLPTYLIFSYNIAQRALESAAENFLAFMNKKKTDAAIENLPEDYEDRLDWEIEVALEKVGVRQGEFTEEQKKEQKKYVKDEYNRLKLPKDEETGALDKASTTVYRMMANDDIKLDKDDLIPRFYDGQLLYEGQKLLGKRLTGLQKNEARKMLKNKLQAYEMVKADFPKPN
ncbi:MAG: hypothetical protein OXE94_03840 [Aestuariivita sp.]|nr:hypothetical protein [Aestuariivita sp.]MCY4203831.1 hypothetical protein [Aestuariivita sp.]